MKFFGDMGKIMRSIAIALSGLRHAYRSDRSFNLEVNYGFPAYVLVGWLLWPFAPLEFLIFTFSYLLILILELVNTAFETMLERLHPDRHELIGKSKDIASASVLLAFVFATLVVVVLGWMRVVD